MIRIAFVIDRIASPTAGTEKQLLLLIKHLDRNCCEPVLCVLQPSPWLERDFDDCPVEVLGIRSFKDPGSILNIRQFAAFLKRGRFDVVHTYFNDGNKAGILAGKFAGVKAIVSSRRNQGYWHTRRELMILKLLNRWVAAFVANSYSTKDWAQRTEGIPPDKIVVIHNGIDLSAYKANGIQARSACRGVLDIPWEAPVVAIVANLRRVKGVDVFLKAANEVCQRAPDAHFIVVGDDAGERPQLEKFARDLGIDSRVHFLGRRSDVPEILRSADIGVLSSHSESLSNSIVEYLAAGLPVVCTDVGGAREIVENGVNGFIVPVGDHSAMAERIADIIDSGAAATMGEAGREKAENRFSVDEMVRRHQETYQRLTQNSFE